MNKCIFIGRLTKDIELTPVGQTQVCKFSLAVQTSEKETDSSYKTVFIDCEAWGNQAGVLKTYVSKGQKVLIVAEYRQKEYIDKKTQEKKVQRYFRVNEVELIDSAKKEPQEPHTTQPEYYQPPQQPEFRSPAEISENYTLPIDDADLPF